MVYIIFQIMPCFFCQLELVERELKELASFDKRVKLGDDALINIDAATLPQIRSDIVAYDVSAQ